MVATPTVRRPSSGRDAGWLGGADLIAVVLAFFGQILLANALLAEHYGWMVLAIDLYASLFLMIDLGLPTLLARDGAKAPEMVRPALGGFIVGNAPWPCPSFSLHSCSTPDRLLNISPPSELLLLAALIGLAHIASYAPRSGLRVLGEARLEAVSKLIERTVTVLVTLLFTARAVLLWLPIRSYSLWVRRQDGLSPLLFFFVKQPSTLRFRHGRAWTYAGTRLVH